MQERTSTPPDYPARLRVCIVAPPSLRIPPFHGYGGSQRGIHDLCEVLHARGHHVTLCGPGECRTACDRLIAPLTHAIWEEDSPYPRAERNALTDRYAVEVAAAIARERFDIVNVRFDQPSLIEALVAQDRAPVLYSCHNSARDVLVDIACRHEGRLYTNAHCRTHRAQYHRVRDMQIVPYGMDVASYRFCAAPLSAWPEPPTVPALGRLWQERRDYLAWMGRIGPSKSTASAVHIARLAGLPLVIAGAPENRNKPTTGYMAEHVTSVVDDRMVFFVGVLDEQQKQELLGGAVATLFTSGLERPEWGEPFGRVLMESLACGTPLVAHAHGSAPELLTPEVATFGRTVEELARTVPDAVALDRARCRFHAEYTFSRERMGCAYEELYRAIVADHARRRTSAAARAGEQRCA